MSVMDRTEIDALERSLAAAVPVGLSFAVDRIGAKEDFAYEREAALMESAGVSRQQEFIAGRRLARQAIARDVPLLVDVDGLPQWPEGWVASISHSRGLCCAVAGASAQFACVGVDLEKTNRLSSAAARRVVHPLEIDFAGEDQLRASLLFCLKEAFYKAQFPRWRTAANFQDLALDLDLACGRAVVAQLAEPFPSGLQQAADRLQFRFGFCGDYVVSLCWLAA